jgi:hypothetical protein
LDANGRRRHLWAKIRREAAMMSQHPENDAIDDWIEATYDWDDFRTPFP